MSGPSRLKRWKPLPVGTFGQVGVRFSDRGWMASASIRVNTEHPQRQISRLGNDPEDATHNLLDAMDEKGLVYAYLTPDGVHGPGRVVRWLPPGHHGRVSVLPRGGSFKAQAFACLDSGDDVLHRVVNRWGKPPAEAERRLRQHLAEEGLEDVYAGEEDDVDPIPGMIAEREAA